MVIQSIIIQDEVRLFLASVSYLFEILRLLTYPRSLPCLVIEEDIAPSFGFRTYWRWIWVGRIFSQPHHELFMISPVPICATIAVSHRQPSFMLDYYSSVAASSCMMSRGCV